MRLWSRMPVLTRMRYRRVAGFLSLAGGLMILINFIPLWVWPALLGVGLVAWGWSLLSTY